MIPDVPRGKKDAPVPLRSRSEDSPLVFRFVAEFTTEAWPNARLFNIREKWEHEDDVNERQVVSSAL
jgi:hypothetical protein